MSWTAWCPVQGHGKVFLRDTDRTDSLVKSVVAQAVFGIEFIFPLLISNRKGFFLADYRSVRRCS